MSCCKNYRAASDPALSLVLTSLILLLRNSQCQLPEYELDKPSSIQIVPSAEGDFFALGLKQLVKSYGEVLWENKCLVYARNVEEPYSARYWRHKKLSLGYPWTEIQRAVWNWTGPITREAFDGAKQRGPPACPGCEETVHMKVIGGRLWIAKAGLPSHGLKYLEEIMKLTLHLYDIPDMEFLVFFGDGCNPGRPTLAYSICRNQPQAGFTMPTTGMWGHSLGPAQMAAYHACLAQRFPVEGRKPQAVWRGATTNHFRITSDNFMKAPRIRLHMMARDHPDLLDAGIVKIVGKDPFLQSIINDTAPFVPMEDYNNYCAILHLDGNGWSDRFINSLVHYPTPVLRAATNRTAAMEHLFAPGDTIELFRPDLSDLLDKVREVVKDCVQGGRAVRRMVVQKQRLARMLLDHVGVAEAMAYTLLTYRNLTDFQPDLSLENFRPLNGSCCALTNLPPRLAEEITASLAGTGGAK